MKRRRFLSHLTFATAGMGLMGPSLQFVFGQQKEKEDSGTNNLDAKLRQDWLKRWEQGILSDARSRYCDKETGEELGWLVSPFLNGFYYGYLATHDEKWVQRLVEWADSCLKRVLKEPDGFAGWPKAEGGGDKSSAYVSDSLLGEAMLLRPIILMAAEIRKTAGLASRYGDKAEAYLKFARDNFEKWDSRGCWREVKNGGLWVVPGYGIDRSTGNWSEGYDQRASRGFSNPANKQNHIARWLLALYDVTQKPVYRERAERWFLLMRSRMRIREEGNYFVWNYWDPAGAWDYKSDGSPRHWVGVHPNGGYYAIDVEGIVAAHEHGLVFERTDIARLIATNRDFMWNQQMEGARFQRIDGGQPDPRWKDNPGTLWTALLPYDKMLRKIFLANHKPAGWGGLSVTPWFLSAGKYGS